MPKISLWNPNKTNDYNFIDRQAREMFSLSGTGAYIHKYIGPAGADGEAPETQIEDVLFLENRSRRYDETIFELRGHYNPENSDFDLTQFGIFLSNDVIYIEFHLNEMVERIGRKLLAGDVIELPHLREYFTLNENDPAFNKFFAVEESSKSASGFGPRWWPHVWRVKAKAISASEEYKDIIGDKGNKIVTDSNREQIGLETGGAGNGGGQGDQNLIDSISTEEFDQNVTSGILSEAECEVPYDPTYFSGYHYYVYNDDNGYPLIYWGTGDGVPPNSQQILGEGESFPDSMEDGDYFLRTDFDRPSLFLKDGCKYVRVEVDMRQCWTAQNQLLDTFIDNDDIITHDDCTTEPSRQALSKVVKPKDMR